MIYRIISLGINVPCRSNVLSFWRWHWYSEISFNKSITIYASRSSSLVDYSQINASAEKQKKPEMAINFPDVYSSKYGIKIKASVINITHMRQSTSRQ